MVICFSIKKKIIKYQKLSDNKYVVILQQHTNKLEIELYHTFFLGF